jgi:predicted alpha/beta superfamily hydrolase
MVTPYAAPVRLLHRTFRGPAMRFLWGGAALVASLLLGPATAAAPYTLAHTEVRELPVSANGRRYSLYVGLPSSYDSAPSRRYPVVYVTDGYWNFAPATVSAANLAIDRAAPECLVVGIGYTGSNPDVGALRQYDFTFPASGNNTGGGRDFLAVLADDFIPYVEANFRADPTYRVLVGASGGGMFSLFTLFARPGLFQAHVVISPGDLRYADNYLPQLARTYALSHRTLPARLFLSYATDEVFSFIRPTTRDLYAQLKSSGYPAADLTLYEITGEGHSGTGAEAINRGLRFALQPLAPTRYTGADPGFSIRSNLINVSTRARVGGGEDVLITGFVVGGMEPKRVLARAAGPALSPQGVRNALPDPRLRVVRMNGPEIGANDNWGDAPDAAALRNAALQAGAFSFAEGSRDAAILLTLEPGAYTVVVESGTGEPGVALAEVYELGR